jgi:hypothetical protein
MTFISIIKNWYTSADSACTLVRDEVCKLIPDWAGQKLGVIPIPDNKHVLFSSYYVDKECVIYDEKTNNFSYSSKEWRSYIPNPLQIFQTFGTQSYFGKDMIIVFFKYTGLYAAYLKKIHSKKEYYSSLLLFFQNEKDFTTCITYCKDIGCLLESTELGASVLENTLDWTKLIDRRDKWYDGHWSKLNTLGILSDYAHPAINPESIEGREGREKSENVEGETNEYSGLYKYKTHTLETFVSNFSALKSEDASCFGCKLKGSIKDFYHCYECIKIVNEDLHKYTLCEKCYVTKIYQHEGHQMINGKIDLELLFKTYKSKFFELQEQIKKKEEAELKIINNVEGLVLNNDEEKKKELNNPSIKKLQLTISEISKHLFTFENILSDKIMEYVKNVLQSENCVAPPLILHGDGEGKSTLGLAISAAISKCVKVATTLEQFKILTNDHLPQNNLVVLSLVDDDQMIDFLKKNQLYISQNIIIVFSHNINSLNIQQQIEGLTKIEIV